MTKLDGSVFLGMSIPILFRIRSVFKDNAGQFKFNKTRNTPCDRFLQDSSLLMATNGNATNEEQVL